MRISDLPLTLFLIAAALLASVKSSGISSWGWIGAGVPMRLEGTDFFRLIAMD